MESPSALAAGRSYSSRMRAPEEEAAYRHDSIILTDDTLRGALLSAFVVSRRDTFPIQVGAFRNESNALKISKGMKNLSNMKVRIVEEKGLYKVRITRIPEVIQWETWDEPIARTL